MRRHNEKIGSAAVLAQTGDLKNRIVIGGASGRELLSYYTGTLN